MRRWPLLAALIAVAAPAVAQTPMERARTLRYAGRLDDAERVTQGVLATRADDYIALYNMGLIEEARARKAAQGPERYRRLELAAGWLERARAVRVAQKPADATIFNTLGAVYIAMGQLGRAEAVLKEGQANEAALSQPSRGKLYNNIGYVSALKGERAKAVPAYEQATRLGNANADKSLKAIKMRRPTAPAKPD